MSGLAMNEVNRSIETEQYFDLYSALTLENFKYYDIDSEQYESATQESTSRSIYSKEDDQYKSQLYESVDRSTYLLRNEYDHAIRNLSYGHILGYPKEELEILRRAIDEAHTRVENERRNSFRCMEQEAKERAERAKQNHSKGIVKMFRKAGACNSDRSKPERKKRKQRVKESEHESSEFIDYGTYSVSPNGLVIEFPSRHKIWDKVKFFFRHRDIIQMKSIKEENQKSLHGSKRGIISHEFTSYLREVMKQEMQHLKSAGNITESSERNHENIAPAH
ncbi:Piso0_002199 [Millerozyma farinosa CBS 7064]|uniref:Piso0_002199 protein n=1 Tax=Pichia sorbitophila (strain ATCC MYA-4447 / BCRC 22081 / CBS 7064 / NBRC 10061 / NRRL Y-12695) TaxID=559304 RepID=G8YBZ1_PICSO|nr:Piso0_002199 [Millerozyma farinosa CBS 7064]